MRVPIHRFGRIHDLLNGEVWSNEDLARAVDHRATVIGALLSVDQRYVVIAHGGTPSFFADLFATWQAGACAVCVNASLTAGELATVVDFVDAAAVLVDGDSTPDTNHLPVPVVCTREETPTSRDRAPCESGLDDPAVILFTSGTTGNPKGVEHTFRSLLSRLALNRAYIGDQYLERALCVLPTHFGHGLIGNCLTPLFSGNELYLYQDTGTQAARALGDLVAENRITFLSSVPAFWRVVLMLGGQPSANTLRQVNVGSAPLSADLWQQIIDWSGTTNVVNVYGITETANWVGGASALTHSPKDGLVGTAWGGCVMIEADDGSLQSEGEGAVVLQTPSLMRGYFRRPDLNAEVMTNGWFRTGDVGRIDAEGTLRLTGRHKHEINRAGIKIQPEEIDLLLERHPHVLEACTFGLPDEVSGEIVATAVHLQDGAPALDSVELRRWCLERIKRESVPERWFFLSELPKTDRGKVDRRRVLESCRSQVRQ